MVIFKMVNPQPLMNYGECFIVYLQLSHYILRFHQGEKFMHCNLLLDVCKRERDVKSIVWDTTVIYVPVQYAARVQLWLITVKYLLGKTSGKSYKGQCKGDIVGYGFNINGV